MPFIIIGIIIALVLIFGGKAIAKKAGALAKKIIKIVVLGYAYMFYMSLVVGWYPEPRSHSTEWFFLSYLHSKQN